MKIKKISTTIVIAFALIHCSHVYGQCRICIGVEISMQQTDVPAATAEYLASRLKQIASDNDIVSDTGMSPFVLTGKFHHIMKETLPGPPIQTALNTSLTLYVGDVNSQTVYSMTSLELRGVGNGSERAYINAMRSLNSCNDAVKEFLSNAKNKILKFYDTNYKQIISRATHAANIQRYEEALWLLSMIPECSKGYDESVKLANDIYQKYIDRSGASLYAAAQSIWAAAQDETAASEAFSYLQLIDPTSNAYSNAQLLAKEIKEAVHSDRQYNLHKKYTDEIDLERERIECIREIGIAYGRGQQPVTTNLNWIK